MEKYKQYKKEYRSEFIDYNYSFSVNLNAFLKKCNENDWRIVNILHHASYEVTVIYEVKIEIK